MGRKYSDSAKLTIQYDNLKEMLQSVYCAGTARLACGDLDYFIESAVRAGKVDCVEDDTVQVPAEKGDIKLSELGLTTRAFNALVRALPRSVVDKRDRTVGEALLHVRNLTKVRNCGKACAANIISRFEAAGIPVPEWKEQTERKYFRK